MRLFKWLGSEPPDLDKIINFAAYKRREWLAAKAAKLGAGSRVLDAGAGEGQYRDLFRHCRYEAQDFAQYGGTEEGILAERWNYGKLDYVCDITQIPVQDGAFDAVICTEVLEHVPEPIPTLAELARVLRPGGALYLTAPLASGLHQEPYHYYGGYTPHFYKRFLPSFGLDPVEIVPFGGLFQHVAQELVRAASVLDSDKGRLHAAYLTRTIVKRMAERFAALDSDIPINEFTVGYAVAAIKHAVDQV